MHRKSRTSSPLPYDPLGLFSLYFDDTLIGLIVRETNRFAAKPVPNRKRRRQ